MGLLDDVLGKMGGPAAGALAKAAMNNPQIISAAIAMLNPKDPVGGAGRPRRRDRRVPEGRPRRRDVVWIGGGPNKPVDPAELASVLGPDILGQFAQKAGSATATRRRCSRPCCPSSSTT